MGPVELYRVLYKHSLDAVLLRKHQDFLTCDKPDKLCPCCRIFGWVPPIENEETATTSRKGFVHFSTATIDQTPVESAKIKMGFHRKNFPHHEIEEIKLGGIKMAQIFIAKDKLRERGDHFDKVYLVVINQPEGVDEKHRRNDTISAAKLIVRLIKERKLFENAHFDCIEVQENPNRYDAVYSFLGEELRKRLTYKDYVVVTLSGGIPALNTGIRDHALGICGKNAELIQTSENGIADFISSWPFRRDQIHRQVRELLRKS